MSVGSIREVRCWRLSLTGSSMLGIRSITGGSMSEIRSVTWSSMSEIVCNGKFDVGDVYHYHLSTINTYEYLFILENNLRKIP